MSQSTVFAEGVDMDEVLSYRPSAFRMLRAFQNVTFIKIDDEENRALKECIYLKIETNRGTLNTVPQNMNGFYNSIWKSILSILKKL